MKEIIDVKRKFLELTYELSGTVDDVIAMLQRLKEQTPEGSTLILKYETDYGSYGDRDRDVVYLFDRRIETDQEYRNRLDTERLNAERTRQQKLDQLAKLKKELGEE